MNVQRDTQRTRTPNEEERESLLANLQELLELPMVILSLIMLALFIVEMAVPISPSASRTIGLIQWFIWLAFVVEFGIKISLATDKALFLRQNWLMALAILLPFLRAFRVFRAARALRSFGAIRVVTVGNRTINKLNVLFERRRLQYLAAVSAAVVLLAGAGSTYIEQNAQGANIRTFGDGLWWAAGTVTTIGTEKFPVTPEGRVLAVITMVFGMGVFAYVAGSLASLFFQIDQPEPPREKH